MKRFLCFINIALFTTLAIAQSMSHETYEYAESLAEQSANKYMQGDYKEAIRLGYEALPIYEKVFGTKEHKDYAACLSNIALYYSKLGDYQKSMQICMEALQIFQKKSDEKGVFECKRLLLGYTFAYIYQERKKENYKEIESLLPTSKALLKEVKLEDTKALATLLGIEAECYERQGNLSLAKQKVSEQIELLEKDKDTNLIYYLLVKKKKAMLEYSLGNSESVDSILKEIIIIANSSNKKIIDEDPDILMSIADIYTYMKDYNSAYKTLCKAINKVKLNKDIESEMIYHLYSTLADIQKSWGNYDNAVLSYNEALRYVPSINKIHRDEAYRSIHLRLAKCYLATHCFKKAYKNFSDAIMFSKLCTNFSGYVPSVVGALLCAHKINKLSNVCENTTQLEDLLRTLWKKNLRDLDEQNRSTFFMHYGNYVEWLIPQMVYEYPQSESLISSGYDASLIYKGLLVEVSRALNFAEQEHYFSKVISTKWTDIREKLNENDVAMEFVSFYLNKDSTMYMAYVLQKDMEHPQLVTLFEEKQLHKSHDLYATSEMSQLVWKPLEKYLNEAKNVYFSPSGELYNIAIESLPHWNDGILMSDKWNMYRLTSTRELALIKDKNDFKHANIYGGVKYDTDEQTLAANSRMFAKSRAMNASSLYQLADTLNMRSGVNYLPSTKEEAIEIDNTLRQKQVKTNLRIESLATESDFKNLDGKNTNLIHVATHGFYWTEREAKYHDDLSFLMIEDNNHKYVEDKALTRSGLLMAGANNALMGKQLPEGVDDGILTAKEISLLDLRGTDLVVLSACQTGLGEIKGDGVFGLQRGFKKAGVQSILMSLWKVDDDATKLLMTQFYKNLTLGTSKHEALKQAQKYVREYKDKDYQDPYFWAAFVLLDAID